MGPVEDEGSGVFLRPETAQGIFVNFKNVLQFARKKPPFGIAQVGKAFRNEITPGNFIFRTREFEQMEIEFFVPPDEADAGTSTGWRRGWAGTRTSASGADHLRLREHGPDELSHYSSATSDIEYLFPMGWSELEGIANRGDFDLTRHAEFSGEKLEYVDSATGERYVPHVIEPSAGGADRATLAFMVDAYDEEEVEGRERVVLRLHPRLAPVKVAVLPLVNKDGQPERARTVYEDLRARMPAEFDTGRLDRQALPPPGRDRHALGRHDRPPDDGGRHRHAARPRLARAGPDRDRTRSATSSSAGSRRRGGRRSRARSARTRPSRVLAAKPSARTRPSRMLAAKPSARTRPSRVLAGHPRAPGRAGCLRHGPVGYHSSSSRPTVTPGPIVTISPSSPARGLRRPGSP